MTLPHVEHGDGMYGDANLGLEIPMPRARRFQCPSGITGRLPELTSTLVASQLTGLTGPLVAGQSTGLTSAFVAGWSVELITVMVAALEL